MTEIQINSTIINSKLNILTSCIGGSTLPILEYIKCDVIANKMIMTSSNLATSIKTNIDVLSTKDTSFLLDGSAIKLIKNIKEEDFTIVIDEENLNVTIKNAIGNFTVKYVPIKDFIELQDIQNLTKVLEIPFNLFQHAFKKLIKFVGTDYTYYPLYTNINITSAKGKIKILSYDGGYTLCSFKTEIPIDKDIQLLLPSTSYRAISSYDTEADSIATLYMSDKINNIIIVVDDIEYHIRKSEGNMPDYSSLIPTATNKIVFDKKPILEALNNLSILTTLDSNILTLTIRESSLLLNIENINFAKNGDVVIPSKLTNIKSEEFVETRLCTSLPRLHDMIKGFVSDEVTLYLTHQKHIIILKTDSDLDINILATMIAPL